MIGSSLSKCSIVAACIPPFALVYFQAAEFCPFRIVAAVATVRRMKLTERGFSLFIDVND